jgi:hypothetical protein
VPATEEQKGQAKEFLDLIKKSSGALKVSFAVGKGDGGAVHISKKKARDCVSALRKQKITTILASGQLKMEDQLTLYCVKDANENMVRKFFFQFFKDCAVSIPRVSATNIRVIGPKDWDSAAEDEDAESAPEEKTESAAPAAPAAAPDAASAAAPAAAAPAPAPAPEDPRPALIKKYQDLVPQMNTKIAARAELKAPLERVARVFQDALRAGAFDNARTALDELTKLVQGSAAPPSAAPQPSKQAANELLAAYQKLLPDVKRKIAEQPAMQAPLAQAAKAFQEAVTAGKLDEGKRMLEQLAQMLAGAPAPAPPADGLGQEFAKRYGALKPDLEAAIRERRGDTSKMRAGVQFALEAAGEKEYGKALKAIEQLERLVAGATGPAEGEVRPGLVEYIKKLHEFDTAKKTVFSRIDALTNAISTKVPDEEDFAEALSDELHDIVDEVDDAIVLALNATRNQSEPVTKEVKARIAEALAQIRGSALVQHADDNPFVRPEIANTLGRALEGVAEAMPAVS